MKIQIMKDNRVGEIKRQFSFEYPFLKLEFLVIKSSGKGPAKQVVVDDNRKLSEIRSDLKAGAMLVSDETTVKDLEAFFRNHLLEVQVFRRSDNLWLETTMTDKWTLERQNNHGKEISASKYSSTKRPDYGDDVLNDVV